MKLTLNSVESNIQLDLVTESTFSSHINDISLQICAFAFEIMCSFGHLPGGGAGGYLIFICTEMSSKKNFFIPHYICFVKRRYQTLDSVQTKLF